MWFCTIFCAAASRLCQIIWAVDPPQTLLYEINNAIFNKLSGRLYMINKLMVFTNCGDKDKV